MLKRLALAILTSLLITNPVNPYPAPRIALPDDLPGMWLLNWNGSTYWAWFDSEGRYYWTDDTDGQCLWFGGCWLPDPKGIRVIEYGCYSRWELAQTAKGWAGMCFPEQGCQPAFGVSLEKL